MVSMVEQLALDFGFASREGRYSIGGILSWSLPAMSEVPAGDRRPRRGLPDQVTPEEDPSRSLECDYQEISPERLW